MTEDMVERGGIILIEDRDAVYLEHRRRKEVTVKSGMVNYTIRS